MDAHNVLYRLTPNPIRDLLESTAGVGVWITAIIGGCAITAPTVSTWFAFWGVAGAVPLMAVAPQVHDAIRSLPASSTDAEFDVRRAA